MRRDDRVERITYRDLEDRAARVAAFLRTTGVEAGDRCAIYGENSADWCAAYLGILQRGAVAVPFDTSYTAAQVATLLRDSGARLLFTSARFDPDAREAVSADVRVVALDAQHECSSADACPAGPADPAVILYTSGTTADPKGVVLTHANLLAEKDGAFAAVTVSERDAVLGVLPLFHALAQMANLLLPLSVGAHVVFLETLNTRELLRALDDEGITIFVCVPQFFYLIHQRIIGDVGARSIAARTFFRGLLEFNARLRRVGVNFGPAMFPRVHRTLGRRMRLLITGGSKLDERVGRDLHALGFTILQAYGLTETSGAATITGPNDPIQTVGRAFRGVEIRVDMGVGRLKPAPTNDGQTAATNDGQTAATNEGQTADGEILIRGPIVMAGYWNRPDATAAVVHDGWLHTGDLGRVDSCGRLTITGRSKEVIVLSSGKNIHPEEIEAHYQQSPFIKELCVLGTASPGQPCSERLHAIVVPDLDVFRQKKIVNTSELIRFELEGLSVSLPPHKRVLGFDISMEPLPRTTTGKLKRREVRARTHAVGRFDGEDVAVPAEPPHVARVIEAVRTVARPGVIVRASSNLELDLGLDSMERVELLALLEQRFGVRVPEEVAQSALVVRDLAEAFRGTTEPDVRQDELAWASLLDATPPATELRSLAARRTIAAPLLFIVARLLVGLLTRPRVSGLAQLPGRGPFILAPNHQSYLDPFVLVGVLPYGVFRELFFVGAAEYFQTPLTAWLGRQLNIVPVDADTNLLPAMQAGAFGLRRGKVLVLFPEGERSIDGTVKKFKKGAAILSHHLRVPVVPVAIDGVFEIWGRNRPPAWRTLLPWSGHHVRIAFGAPLQGGSESYAGETARLRHVVEEMWSKIHQQPVA